MAVSEEQRLEMAKALERAWKAAGDIKAASKGMNYERDFRLIAGRIRDAVRDADGDLQSSPEVEQEFHGLRHEAQNLMRAAVQKLKAARSALPDRPRGHRGDLREAEASVAQGIKTTGSAFPF